MKLRVACFAFVFYPMYAVAVTVSLTAVNGSFHPAGTTVTLNATVRPTPLPSPTVQRPSIRLLKPVTPTYNYTYEYAVNRLSPCQETITVSGNGASTTWSPPASKGGKYTARVTVVEKIREANGRTSESRATASTPLTITNTGQPVKVTLSNSGQTVNVLAKATPPVGGPYTYHFRVFAISGGPAGTYGNPVTVGGYDGDQSSMTTSFNWTLSSAVHVEVQVDAVGKTDCSLVSSVGTADRNLQ